MSDYKVIKLPQAEFDNLGGDIWWIKQGISSYKKPEWMGNLWRGDGLNKHTRNLEVMIKYRDYSKDIHEKDSLVKFEPIASGEFTLDMLKSGKHGVVTRNGDKFVVAGDKLIDKEGWISIFDYKEDLTHYYYDDHNYDIMKIIDLGVGFSWDTSFEDEDVIWERKEEQSNSNELLIGAIDELLDKLHETRRLLESA